MDISQSVTGLIGRSQHQIIVYPDYRAANPYQRLLHAGLDPCFRAETTSDWQDIIESASDPFLLHLHWEDAIYRMEPDIGSARIRSQAFVDTVERFKDRGGQLIWTVHNEEPHDGRYIKVHTALCNALAPMVDLFLVHHPTALLRLQQRMDLPSSRVAVLPHGNYCGEYSRLGPGREQRRELAGFKPDDRVLLIFGRLDSYKGTSDFLAAFERIDSANLRLLIAGKQVDDVAAQVAALSGAARERIDYRPGFVAPAEVSGLFDLADMIATPYRAILTSGTAMLAMSVGRPVLAPGLPGLCEWLDDGVNAILYRQESPDDLTAAIQRFLELDSGQLAAMSDNAHASAQRYPWAPVHILLNGIYARCLTRRRPPRLAGLEDWYRLD